MALERSLRSLLGGLPVRFEGDPETSMTSIAYDSRRTRPGNVFVAIPGFVHDGMAFAPEALKRGAAAVVAERDRAAEIAPTACWATVEDARLALAEMACRWYENPSHQLEVVGITGTNGKTTVTALLAAILQTRGPVGRWSTTKVEIGGRSFATPRTTPESLELQQALAQMRTAGCWAAAIEVSSHALRLRRVHGTRFRAAAFTNLSPDHLDFHADMDDYLEAKAILFRGLAATAPAIINTSDPVAQRLAEMTTGRVVGYGWPDTQPTGLQPRYLIIDLQDTDQGSRQVMLTPAGEIVFRTRLFGRANAENVAAAIATAMELGVGVDAIIRQVASFAGEPGRLQSIDAGQPFDVLVDFAHTPGALEAAIDAAASRIRSGRLIVVFGCGGDRDRAKRPQMGRIAARHADKVIVTSDNPRSEDPDLIIQQILAGVPAVEREHVEIEPDRAVAIASALAIARAGDCVLIAGKGHETEQVFADRVVAFDDSEVALTALQQRSGEWEER